MKRTLYRQGRWLLLLSLLLLGMLANPVKAAQQGQQATTNLDAYVYLPTEALKPIFQNQINQQVNTLSAGVIDKMLESLPKANQGWAKDMAGALIQPSATLSQLTPQEDGLAATVSLNFYPGDPKPTNAAMLVTFSVRDASTIQVSAQPVPGSPQLANGPLTTFAVPVGQLMGITTTPDCGSAGIDVHIQLPVTFNASIASTQSQSRQIAQSILPANQTLADIKQPHVAHTTQKKAASTLDAYAEVPNSSLNSFASKIPPLPIPNTIWTAQNFRISTQDNGLVITSDISSLGIVLASTRTNVRASAENGRLVMHVTSTTLTVAIFHFAMDTYNQQIEDLLNNNLGNALAGKFTVNDVAVGGGTALSCAGSDSLILKGTTNLA
jgi:hypothetical protein